MSNNNSSPPGNFIGAIIIGIFIGAVSQVFGAIVSTILLQKLSPIPALAFSFLATIVLIFFMNLVDGSRRVDGRNRKSFFHWLGIFSAYAFYLVLVFGFLSILVPPVAATSSPTGIVMITATPSETLVPPYTNPIGQVPNTSSATPNIATTAPPSTTLPPPITPTPSPTDTDTPVPTDTDTLEPQTDTPIPPTDTPIPPTDTPVPPTDTPVPSSTNTPIPPTFTLSPTTMPTDSFPPPNTTPTFGGNWLGEYFKNVELKLPAFCTPPASNVNFERLDQFPCSGMPSEYWSARWTTTTDVCFNKGTATFYVKHDDALKILIDGEAVYENDLTNDGSWLPPINVITDCHSLVVEYKQFTGGASLRVGWHQP